MKETTKDQVECGVVFPGDYETFVESGADDMYEMYTVRCKEAEDAKALKKRRIQK
jgi:hypothetical protein